MGRNKRRLLGVTLSALALLISSMSGCGGRTIPPREIDLFRSGTRLRAVVDEVEGARRLTGWFDKELNVKCRFDRNRPDHHALCVPTALIAHASPGEGGLFADSGCTQVLGSYTQDPALPFPPTWVVVDTPDACTAGPSVHLAGDHSTPFYQLRDGACKPIESRPPGIYYAIGALASPFVEAVEMIEPRGGRIDSLVLVASDGAREVVAGYDSERKESVTAARTSDGQIRFLPEAAAFTNGHSSCDESVASKIAHSARCPMTIALGTCGEVFAIEHPTTLEEAKGHCKGRDLDMMRFAVGPRLDEEQFAVGTPAPMGSGRIRIAAVAEGTQLIAPLMNAFFDTRLNHTCWLRAAEQDGSARCAPSSDASTGQFADPSCLTPAVLTQANSCAPRAGDLTTIGGKAFTLVGDLIPVFSRSSGDDRCQLAGEGFHVAPINLDLAVATARDKVE